MSDFTYVSHKKKKRNKKNSAFEFDEQSEYYFNKLKYKTIQAQELVACSDIYSSVKSLIEDSLRTLNQPSVQEIVCYGLGNFSDCNNALYQYGLLLQLKQLLNCEVHVFDPVFKQIEKSVISDANCSLIELNENGKREACKATLFYLPHCPNELLNNIISANWGDKLRNCIIISNSVSEINVNKTDRELKATLPFIFRILPFVTETKIPNNFKYVDVFNDLSLHIFQEENFSSVTEIIEDLENLTDSISNITL